MARFNTVAARVGMTKNAEGADAFVLSSELELYAITATTFLGDAFYEKADARIQRIRELIARCDAGFVQRLAVYNREQQHLRSVPILMLAELAIEGRLDRRAVARVIQRPDEITELLACFQALAPAGRNNRPAGQGAKKLNKLSNQLKKGLAAAFHKFDEHSFAKYDQAKEIKLRDALFLCHPKPRSQEEMNLFKVIANKELRTPDTWEVAISATKGDRQAKAEEWTRLLTEGKLGYMAILRNLRNFIQAGISAEVMERHVCAVLTDEERILKSKQLPFRFLSAYRELRKVDGCPKALLSALDVAVRISIRNVDGLDTQSALIACDVSGSMQWQTISTHSKIRPYDIGLLLGFLLQSRESASEIGIFGDTFELLRLDAEGVLARVEMADRIEGRVGYSTNGHKVIDYCLSVNAQFQDIIMFTDCQMWDSERSVGDAMKRAWTAYKQVVPSARLILFDLSGYGNTPVRVQPGGVYLIAGWSDKLFAVLRDINNGADLLAHINSVVI